MSLINCSDCFAFLLPYIYGCTEEEEGEEEAEEEEREEKVSRGWSICMCMFGVWRGGEQKKIKKMGQQKKKKRERKH